MGDLADEVPQRAYINAQIIQRAMRDGTLDVTIKAVCRENGYPSVYEFNNPALHLSLLYCLIVFPREFWDGVDLSNATQHLNEQCDRIISLFDITCWSCRPQKDVIYNSNQQGLLTKIRNAVSHAHISVAPSLTYRMWDQRNDLSPKNFECSITAPNLGQFLTIVGSTLANIRATRSGSEAGRRH